MGNDRLETLAGMKRQRGFNLTPRRAFTLTLAVIVLVWVLMNRDDARVSLIFKDVTAPLWIVLGITFILGVICGFILDRDSRD